MEPQIQPLPYKNRRKTFLFLLIVFLVSLPFLYLYATGYRFSIFTPTNIVSTGGIYVAVDRTGAEIYIDGELVRETRTFRKAFYAQNLNVGTRRVHVQKEGYHTWVKELPVTRHRVTEAQAFNLPLVPQVRVISPWQTATGSMVIRQELKNASSTNNTIATTTMSTSTLIANQEFAVMLQSFATTSTSTVRGGPAAFIRDRLQGGTDEAVQNPTTTIVSNDVELRRIGDDIVAAWVGSFELMPYYYCAPPFPRYSTSTGTSSLLGATVISSSDEEADDGSELIHPVQTIAKDAICIPSIRIDRKDKIIQDFSFFPGNSDLVILVEEDGIYVVEIDNRAWQNVQPLFIGKNLRMHIENGNIFVYDGNLIYQVMLTAE